MLVVLNVAYPFAPVGPDAVGGAEHVLAAIDAQLVAEHEHSIVLAAERSRAAGQVATIPQEAGWIDDAVRARTHAAVRHELARLIDEHGADVVHLHGADFDAYLPGGDVPCVATLHLARPWYGTAALTAPGVHRICVSHGQRAGFGARVEIADVIENGVPLERYAVAPRKGRFALALGRICPEKGFHLAAHAARLAGVPLVIGGAVFPYESHGRYARDVLAPALDADRRWVGPVAGDHKRRLLAQACCLLVTSTVDETSSLAAMEALASGTPVVGFARGALPDLIEHGVTGWLVDDERELPTAIARAATLSPAACRAAAEARCAASRMTARYLELYRALARPRRRRPARLELSIATHDAELAAIADEWDALCDRCPTATAFQRPGWLLAYRRWFGHGGEPRVAVLRRGDRLVGVVPLEVRGGRAGWIGEGITDYLDAIVEPDVEPALLAEAVRRVTIGAYVLELSALRPCSPLLAAPLGGTLAAGTPSPVTTLADARAPRRLEGEQRRLARLASRWIDERDDSPALLDALFDLHRARWESRGEPGVLAAAGLAGFHREALAALARHEVVRLIGLVIDGRVRAVLHGFAEHGRFQCYLSGFAPELAKLSPGRLLVARAIERAKDDGQFELDFLRGQEPYKYEWGAVDRPAATLRVPLLREVCA